MRAPGPSASIRAAFPLEGAGSVRRDYVSKLDEREGGDEAGKGGSRRLGRRQAKAYQWALESAFSILIGAGVGYWADSRFDTSPTFLLLGLAVGFGAFVRGLLRIRKLVEEEAGAAPPGDDR